MKFWANGPGELLGDQLATGKPYYFTASTWFVNSATGTDAGGSAGQDREKPLATLGQAITNASAGDTVILMDGHTETLTATLAISKQLYIAGGGSSGGIPTVSFTMNATNQDTFNVSAGNTELRNIWFKESAQSNSGSTGGKVHTSVSGCRIVGCYFSMGANDQYAGLFADTAPTSLRVESCTFISTATTRATRPTQGMTIRAAASDVEIYNCIFSDGLYGFTSRSLDTSTVTLTRTRIVNLSLLLGASMAFGASSTGFISGLTQTGGGRVDW